MPDWSDVEEQQRQKSSKNKLLGSKPQKDDKRKHSDSSLNDTYLNPKNAFVSIADLAKKKTVNPVISFYLSLTPDKTQRNTKVYFSFFNSQKHKQLQAKKNFIASLPHTKQTAIGKDLAEIEDFLADYFSPQDAKSLIIFKSGKYLNEIITLPVYSTDRLVIDPDPYLSPLEAIIEYYPKVLLVSLSPDSTRFFTYLYGFHQEIEKLKSFVPGTNIDKSRPAKVQRERQDLVDEHLRESAKLTDHHCEINHCDVIILLGQSVLVDKFIRYLSSRQRANIIGQYNLPPSSPEADINRKVEDALFHYQLSKENKVIGEIRENPKYLTSTLPAVLQAQNRFIIRRLFIDISLTQPGFVCKQHQFLSLDGGICPVDSEPLDPVENIVDELIETAKLHHTEIIIFQIQRELLEPYSGIAAFTYKTS